MARFTSEAGNGSRLSLLCKKEKLSADLIARGKSGAIGSDTVQAAATQ